MGKDGGLFRHTELTEEEWETWLELCPAPLHWGVVSTFNACRVTNFYTWHTGQRVNVAVITVERDLPRKYELVKAVSGREMEEWLAEQHRENQRNRKKQ
ncbi:hypothetical protein [Rufibacter quisquiliarum]|uniref:Uncharacterized protein n=1 Tax=Rufibacter quisquiliarum TaxID=1549639 RepID=A0A839GX83_9BACT|nr:hypothetical protein [Rufibacter quisquiliarum]MBA9078331.1 hypothetical protein [Rufibacter quisquiliarum]